MKKNNYCINCNTSITYHAKRCPSCANSLRNKGKKRPRSGKSNKRWHHTEETKLRISLANMEDRHAAWKGDKVGYDALHSWVRRNKPKPIFCEICNKQPPRDLANISGLYKRDIKDFEYVCRKCHMKKDKRLEVFKRHEFGRRFKKNNKYYCIRCKKYKTKENFYMDNNRVDKLHTLCKICYEKRRNELGRK